MGGHEIAGHHGAQGNDVFVGTTVAHHANTLDRQEDGKGLAGQVVPALADVGSSAGAGSHIALGSVRRAQFIDEDGVGTLQQMCRLQRYLAKNAHTEARPGEGVAIDHLARQAERDAEFADFVLDP